MLLTHPLAQAHRPRPGHCPSLPGTMQMRECPYGDGRRGRRHPDNAHSGWRSGKLRRGEPRVHDSDHGLRLVGERLQQLHAVHSPDCLDQFWHDDHHLRQRAGSGSQTGAQMQIVWSGNWSNAASLFPTSSNYEVFGGEQQFFSQRADDSQSDMIFAKAGGTGVDWLFNLGGAANSQTVQWGQSAVDFGFNEIRLEPAAPLIPLTKPAQLQRDRHGDHGPAGHDPGPRTIHDDYRRGAHWIQLPHPLCDHECLDHRWGDLGQLRQQHQRSADHGRDHADRQLRSETRERDQPGLHPGRRRTELGRWRRRCEQLEVHWLQR